MRELCTLISATTGAEQDAALAELGLALPALINEVGKARDFVRARLCDFSLRCFEEPLPLPANRKASIPATFVASVAEEYPARAFFAPFAAKARALGWEVAELNTGHDSHVERPGEVADILLAAAQSQ